MLRFVPVERPGGERERMRQALLSARRAVREALGPDAVVGPISAGGFEVFTREEGAEEAISGAIAEATLSEPRAPGLVMSARGMISPDEPSSDGSMVGL